ncbi:MAG: hypothetical protein U1E53_04750 [Dongiaceae bacterium]
MVDARRSATSTSGRRTTRSDPNDVVVDEPVKTHTIVFASANGAADGRGTKGDSRYRWTMRWPWRRRSLQNAIIVVQGDAGDRGDAAAAWPRGSALLGGGSKVPLPTKRALDHGRVQGAGLSRPTLVGTNPTRDLIDMAAGTQNEIYGRLDIVRDMANAVFGLNMAARSSSRTIDPPVQNGVSIEQTTEASIGAPPGSFVHLESNSDRRRGSDGLKVTTLLDDGEAYVASPC